MIRELISNQGSFAQPMMMMPQNTSGAPQQVSYSGGGGRLRPPVPSMGIDGEVAMGYSGKFQQNLEVADRDGRAGLGEQTRYDVAFLQLQLQEAFELVRRKDEELAAKNHEVEGLYKRVREYLVVQDQLYKDYVRGEKETHRLKEDNALAMRNVQAKYHEEQLKVANLEKLVQSLGASAQGVNSRLIELSKQNSLLDVNLIRMTRAYETLKQQEELLRRDFHNREADQSEKDIHVQQRINDLKTWKARAIQQLKYLFTKLRMAVPRTEYECLQSEAAVLKQKNADYIERNSKLAERVSKLQTQVRENMEGEERLRNAQEARDDLENEYEIVRKRLEHIDP
jgi:hypothetical protein